MDLRRMRYFVTVAEERSFTKAAVRLHISQPPLSQNIKALEDEMGVQLLTRDHLGATPTDAGLAFLRHARHILGSVQTAVDDTVRVAAGKSESIRLGVITSSLFQMLPPIIAALQDKLPDADITIFENNSHAQIKALQLGDIDFAIVHGPLQVDGMYVKTLCVERMCAVLPLNHPLAGSGPIAVKALAQEDFILGVRDLAPVFFDNMISLCVRSGFSPRIRHTARDSQTMVKLAALGFGVTIVSEALIPAYAGKASFRRIDDPSATFKYCLVCRPESGSGLVARTLIEANGISEVATGGQPSEKKRQ